MAWLGSHTSLLALLMPAFSLRILGCFQPTPASSVCLSCNCNLWLIMLTAYLEHFCLHYWFHYLYRNAQHNVICATILEATSVVPTICTFVIFPFHSCTISLKAFCMHTRTKFHNRFAFMCLWPGAAHSVTWPPLQSSLAAGRMASLLPKT